MKNLTPTQREFILVPAHIIITIIFVLDMFCFINSFKDSEFLTWDMQQQIAFRCIIGLIAGAGLAYLWEVQIQEGILGMPSSRKDVITMIVAGGAAGALFPFINASLTTLIVGSVLSLVAMAVYIVLFLKLKNK